MLKNKPIIKSILTIALITLLIGCDQPRVDAQQNLLASLENLKNSLEPQKQKTFAQAISPIYRYQEEFGNVRLFEASLHGQTADEIIALAPIIEQNLQRSLKTKQRMKENPIVARPKIKRMTAPKKASKLFGTTQAIFSFDEKPKIQFLFQNYSQQTVSKIYFESSIKEQGHRRNWTRTLFEYQIAEGVAPRKQKQIEFFPEKESGGWWRAPRDATLILTVKIYRADDATGKGIDK
ncbi:hypothetical protein [Candidatus Uabimicrobium sp. HlEnr_7]|uniref:hypothetical protein n=1 Tax=Candidatus Uabimicrobium helgolandensis TaxID=3095367 RepID=UPI003557F7BA